MDGTVRHPSGWVPPEGIHPAGRAFWSKITPMRRSRLLFRAASLAALALVATALPVAAVPAAYGAVEAECAAPRAACPMAAAMGGGCPDMPCCARRPAPSEPVPLDQAVPVAAAQLVAPLPAVVATVVEPVSRATAAPSRPVHAPPADVPLFTLHATFLI